MLDLMRTNNSSSWEMNDFRSFEPFVGVMLARISAAFVVRESWSGLFWIWSFQVEGRLGRFDTVIFDEVLFSFKITRAINNL